MIPVGQDSLRKETSKEVREDATSLAGAASVAGGERPPPQDAGKRGAAKRSPGAPPRYNPAWPYMIHHAVDMSLYTVACSTPPLSNLFREFSLRKQG